MRRPELLAIACLTFACKRDVPPAPAPASASADAAIVDASAPDVRPQLDAAAIQDAVDDRQRSMGLDPIHPRTLKSIGHTSVVFRVDTTDGRKIVWKPHSKRGHERYRGEIAAFRLGLALKIDAVPKAYEQAFYVEELNKSEHDEKAMKLLSEELVPGDDNLVRGAMMPWIDDYELLPLEKEPLLSQWRGWLKKDGRIPDDKKEMAQAISTLILFDYVTGNWDRWSGGNVATSGGRAGGPRKIIYVDNDGAFFENPPKDGLVRNRRNLDGVDRYSKSFVDALRGLTRERLRETMRAIVSDKAQDGVLARRDEALAIVDKKELFFP